MCKEGKYVKLSQVSDKMKMIIKACNYSFLISLKDNDIYYFSSLISLKDNAIYYFSSLISSKDSAIN